MTRYKKSTDYRGKRRMVSGGEAKQLSQEEFDELKDSQDGIDPEQKEKVMQNFLAWKKKEEEENATIMRNGLRKDGKKEEKDTVSD